MSTFLSPLRLGKTIAAIAIIPAIVFFISLPAFSEEAPLSGELSVVFENDVFFHTDHDYTNGVGFFWVPFTPAPEWLVRVARWIPWFPEDGTIHHGYAVGQSIFTPNKITLAYPPPNDRPYAGWLYLSRGIAVDTDRQFDIFAITVGVVGPASYAEQTQKFIHNLVNTDEPQGWNYQLRNELGFYVTYQRTWRELASKKLLGLDFDVAPHLGGALGNVYTYANGGFTLRYGQDLPRDSGPPRIQPSALGSVLFEPTDRFTWYLFVSPEGRVVAHNIFLDGNTFKDSRSVDKKPLVGDLQWGIVMTWHKYRLSFTDVFRTKEWDAQKYTEHYGSICFSMGI